MINLKNNLYNVQKFTHKCANNISRKVIKGI